MPSIYDFRHVELDKVGRGKRIIKAPGGGSNNIFGAENGQQPLNGNGSISETESVDGSLVLSCPSTPVHQHTNGNGTTNGNNNNNNTQFGYESDTSSTTTTTTTGNGSGIITPPGSTTSSRRGSLQDTKNRLFGQADQGQLESPRRRVVDRMKSNIFGEADQATNVVRTPSVKKYDHVVRRNPITGEVLDESPSNGNSNGSMNGTNGTASMPNTPVRVRQPPGGKTSNIFG